MSELSERLREAHPNSQQYALGSNILLEAAQEIESLQAQLSDTYGDQYRSELYVEMSKRAEAMGYRNVINALIELERLKQPDVVGLVEALDQCVTSMLDSGYRPTAAAPEEATPEMEQAAEQYWNERRFKGLTNDPRTWAGVYRAMRAVAPQPAEQQPECGCCGQTGVTALVEALEPFAKCARELDGSPEDGIDPADDDEWAKFRLLVSDYRRARAALAAYRKGGEA